ncbi:unnamed protein product [Cylicocyclus nassatus]|uniref:MARVEL domain-containing protein n=1 Tax=Cylicocyclus nassatus TaxID=53992 RepID=A0AA36MBN0_CYLNA|nr:unnamed protein product [Cylicocyclus nassatus]
MTLADMKGLPHLVKPVALVLILFQVIFVFAPGYRGFGWFVITTTMIQLIACILTFLLIFANITVLTEAPFWPMAEMGYSGAFTLFELINFFYFLVNMCNHYNFWLMCGEFFSAFLCLIWLFNALQWLRAPPPLTTSEGPSKRGRSNQNDPQEIFQFQGGRIQLMTTTMTKPINRQFELALTLIGHPCQP